MTQPGTERTDVEPAWPIRLHRPDVPLVYLDLNHWIGLAKAEFGHPDGRRFRPALDTLHVHCSKWRFVISMPLIMELTGNLRRRQRETLACVIEDFTGFACVLPFATIAGLELDEVVGRISKRGRYFHPVDLQGHGVLRACGLQGGIRVWDASGADVTAKVRAEAPIGPAQFDKRLEAAERDLDRSVLRGPSSDDEEQYLRDLGWDPSVARRVAIQQLERENEQAARLKADPTWRRGRLRDLITARYLGLDIENTRGRVLREHDARMSRLTPDIDAARRFADSMPATDNRITLLTAKHRNVDSKWTPNDIFDIDALAVSAAYCDVVVAERHSMHVLRQAGVEQRYETALLTSLDQLAEHVGH